MKPTSRWCINLVLRSIDKMLMCNSTMDSEDLVEVCFISYIKDIKTTNQI